jgi:transcriptional regulator with XRE-family HTH domain
MTQPELPAPEDYDQMATAFMKKLRDRRLEMGLSQAALAAHMDVAPSNIGFWEKGGRIPFYRFLQMSDALRFNFGIEPFLDDVRRVVEEIDELHAGQDAG